MSYYPEIGQFIEAKTAEVLKGGAFGRDLQIQTLAGMRRVAAWMESVDVQPPNVVGLGQLTWTEGGKPKVKLQVKLVDPSTLPEPVDPPPHPRLRADRVLHVTLIDYHDLDDPDDDKAFVFTHALTQRQEVLEALIEVFG